MKPIIFNGDMIRALKHGKTQTRRVIKSDWPIGKATDIRYLGRNEYWEVYGGGGVWKPLACPFGKVGLKLWVRETWAEINNTEYGGSKYTEYKADTNNPYPGDWPEDEARGNDDAPKWKPSIHMPRYASRFTLTIKRIWVERVQDISEADAKAEGVNFVLDKYNVGVVKHLSNFTGLKYKPAFSFLWDSIYLKQGYGWDTNPLVFCNEFEVVT